MDKVTFEQQMRLAIQDFMEAIATQKGEWLVRGLVDLRKKVFPIPSDTKVISKAIELAILPVLEAFAQRNNFTIEPSIYQNHYPDVTLTHHYTGFRYAVDIKSSYRIDDRRVNGMTLGTYTGYFRERNSRKNILYPYSSYHGHYVLGIIYSRYNADQEQMRVYSLEDIEHIPAIVGDFRMFFHEKYKIASDKPGSGNTRNIGSVIEIEKLVAGTGPFAELGEEVFDDYWMHYETHDMARRKGMQAPRYTNLATYLRWRQQGGMLDE